MSADPLNDGGPAFPGPDLLNAQQFAGMTLCDYFAAKAMEAGFSGHLAHYGHEQYWSPSDIASHAYDMASAMLQARAARQQPAPKNELLQLARELAAIREGLENSNSGAEDKACRLAARAAELVAKTIGGAV